MGKVWERYDNDGVEFFFEDLEGLQNHDCFLWGLQLWMVCLSLRNAPDWYFMGHPHHGMQIW
jgi:hypothetical protein